MLSEGTKQHSASELAYLLDSKGMAFAAYPGGAHLRVLTQDFVAGLDILAEILTEPAFNKKSIEKVRHQMIADIKNYWDEPWDFAGQLIREKIYKGHPYSISTVGSEEVVKQLTRDELINFYDNFISPDGAVIAMVGDLDSYDIKILLENSMGKWKGKKIEDIVCNVISPQPADALNYSINRDQVVLCFAGLSIARTHPDYDALLLFDQIFAGGALGSMSSRLFDLREQSGLFYTINGSLVVSADEQPGIFMVKTLVSLDRLAEAEAVIKDTINNAVETITEDELAEAKRAVINSLIDRFASSAGTAHMFLFMNKYGFKVDFFNNRSKDLDRITLEQVKAAVRRVISGDKIFTLRIGRIGQPESSKLV